VLDVLPQLVGNRGLAGLKLAIAEPDRFAIEPKVDGVRGLLAFLPEGTMETRTGQAFEPPYELSPVVTPDLSLVEAMMSGELEGLVLKDRSSAYRDGGRGGWTKVKDPSWYARESWRFERR
jgi:hypothetical protein